jgi:cell division protein FtsB
MVVRSRLRAFLIPLVLYIVSAAVVGYFVYHAQHGDRGIATKMALKQQIVDLQGELDTLKAEHAEWDSRVAMLRTESVDRDLLEEQARLTLNRLHRNDVVIMTGGAGAAR